ncbi:ABC transporter ATP-binding protein [Gordonia soli]|uniref:Putative ABC transporter permease/ATP-binding protein n=1 Tax=Gordonia soli NBRC 108243 TaxID=1223545 RepID=M0QHS6_9ACTN|nr:ABC transporter ATP-binding protein [Gordonia soli]GAC68108.1 putative ABC transporter permease/ATP-binding protein [Gordonia soli NBRC 108243]
MIRGFLTILGSQRRQMFGFLLWATTFGVAQGLAMLVLVPFVQALLDLDGSAAVRWLLWLLLLVAICCITFYVQSIRGMRLALFTMRTLHHRLGEHLVTLPLGWFTRRRTGEVSQIAVKGTMFVGSTSAHFFTPVIANTTSSLVVVVGLLFFDWRIGLVAAAGAVLLYVAAIVSSSVIASAEEANHRVSIAVNNRVLEFARCQPVLRAFGRAGTSYEPLAEVLDTQYRTGRRMMWRSVAGISLNGVAVQAVFTAILAFGAWLAVTDRIEPALLIAVFGLAARFTGPVGELADLGSTLRMARDEIKRITDVLETESIAQPAEPQPVSMPGSVEVEHVRFGYVDGEPVARDISFRAEPGTMTALVGPSGSGKTTLFRLLARFYDVDGGVVRVGGVDVRDQDTATLMGQLSQVFQDVYLFDDTLRENIRIGRPDATDEEIAAAAETAGVGRIVDRLHNGWDTPVGEGGSALSGGERQRVSIARALLKGAPIVLFDEATSALDPENEAHVAASIRELADNSTVIVIAHKLSTVVAADQIVVLDDEGGVDDVGTHAELIGRGGQYARFWHERTAAAGWAMAH